MRKNLNSLHLLVSTAAFAVTAITASSATLVFQEDFGILASSTAITASNTGLGGARASDGSLTATTSTIGTGSSLQVSSATSAGTNSGAWIAAGGLGALTAMTMEFTVHFSRMKSGALSFTMGNGNTVANNFNNDGRNDNHFLWDLAIVGSTGSLWYMTRTGAYQDTGYVLTRGESYHFVVQVNTTNSALDGVASNTMRLFINGDMVSDSLPVRGATSNANGFRIGARNANSSCDLVAELDDIRIWNGITAIPEPSIATLSVIGSIWFVSRRRRSTAQVSYRVNTSIPG